MTQNKTDIVSAAYAAQSIVLIAHTQPDGDTLGACFAMRNVLQRLGKTVRICCEKGMPRQYASLFPEGVLVLPENIKGHSELVIALDCADRSRLGTAAAVFDGAIKTINIDHHISNGGYADINWVMEASSVGEMVFQLIQPMGVELDEYSAKYIYIAISTDTGNFTYSNTTKTSMAAAAELIELFDLRATAEALFRRRSIAATKLIGLALASLETFAGGRIAAVALTEEEIKSAGAASSDCENIVDYAREIEETKAAAFFRETNGGVKASLRSKGNVDVGAVAQSFGGGGHMNAAGCTLQGSIESAKKQVIEKLMEIV